VLYYDCFFPAVLYAEMRGKIFHFSEIFPRNISRNISGEIISAKFYTPLLSRKVHASVRLVRKIVTARHHSTCGYATSTVA